MPFHLSKSQLAFMETFGYLSFPGLLSDRIQAIEQAFEEVMAREGGLDHKGKERLGIAPFLNHHPYLCSLLDDERINGIAESVIGPDYQYWNSDGNYYVGDTPWHSDTGWPEPIRFYKMALYLDSLTRDAGALRVIPGSHRFGEGYAETIQSQISSKEVWGGLHGSEVPAMALETQPGDLVMFNHSTKHSAWGGSEKRRMFTLVFTEKHITPDAVAHFKENVRGHRYTKKDVFGVPEGPLLTTGSPERRHHLTQLMEHVPDTLP